MHASLLNIIGKPGHLQKKIWRREFLPGRLDLRHSWRGRIPNTDHPATSPAEEHGWFRRSPNLKKIRYGVFQ